MKKTAQMFRWLGRVLSGLMLIFVSAFVILYFVGGNESSSGPLSGSDYMAIAASLMLLVGLAISWKWELAGAAVTLIGCAAFLVINGQMILSFPGILAPLTAVFFIASWWMRGQQP